MAEGSVLFTLAGLASIGGALVGGFALDWSGRPLMMMAAVFVVNAALNSTLALCEPLALMAAVYFLSHFTLSIYDVVVSPHLASLWPGRHSGQFLQALHFSFSVGAFLSPLATQPFLAPRPMETHLNLVNHTEQHLQDHLNLVNHTEQHLQDHRYQSATRAYEDNNYNRSSFIADGNGGFMTFFENSTSNHSSDTVTARLPGERERSTRVFYALLISGCLCLIVAVLMVILMVLPVQKLKAEERLKAERQIPAKGKKVYLAALLMVGVYNFLGSSVEDVFPHYLMTFVVRHLHWSKRWGAEVTSVYWVGLAVGRLGGVGLVKVLSPARILVLCLSAMMTSLLVMLVASIVRAHWAVWLGAGAVGLSTSVLFPTGLTYVHQHVSPLTGRVSALVFTTPMVAAMVNPVLLAALMTRVHDLAYLLLFLLQTALALVSFLTLHALARHLNHHRQAAVIAAAAAAAADDDDDVIVREKLMLKEEGSGMDAVHS